MIEPVKAVRDESGHWYVIPDRLYEKFNFLSEQIDLDEENYDLIDEFEMMFNRYRTGGDLNNIQLWAKLG